MAREAKGKAKKQLRLRKKLEKKQRKLEKQLAKILRKLEKLAPKPATRKRKAAAPARPAPSQSPLEGAAGAALDSGGDGTSDS
ncbi:MAG TPA: hypothetical protein VEV21_01585 [Burkholderiales bacterium]|nr:hypothetical protein [Burkholderiales bacterium]